MPPRLRPFFAPVVLALACASCDRAPTIASIQVDTGRQPRREPVVVEGCLRAGILADSTWVLLGRTVGSSPSDAAATYELVGAVTQAFPGYRHRRVRVTGTLESEQQITSTTGMVPEADRPVGTSGSSTRAWVGTTSVVNLRRVRVTSVEPRGGRCR